MDLLLPYKIGDLAECKSSVIGYRGAWFRCKVHNMRVNDLGYLEYYLKYTDYDEEEMEWVGVFQQNPTSSNQNSGESTEIMIRPSFPQWYYGHEVPEQLPVSDVTAIVDETWKVGDLVDWFKQGCYWSGKITKLVNKYMVKIELPAPPIGEGRRYSANRKDLRPTLEWSLAKGWTVPLAQANGKSWHTARLLRHYKFEPDKSTSGDEISSDDEDGGDENGDVQQSVSRASNMPQEASGPVVPASPSATNSASSQNARKDVAPRSQPAGVGISVRQEPGFGTTAEQEQVSEGEVDDGADQYLERLDAVEARIKCLIERTRLEPGRNNDLLPSLCGASKDVSG